MNDRHTLLIVAAALLLPAAAGWTQEAAGGASGSPSTRRLAVKRGTDPGVSKVASKPVKTTIEKLLDHPRPVDLLSNEPNPDYETRRAEPVETTIWTVEAEIVSHQLMPDGDFLVVLKGESGKTIAVELPDPALAGPKSRWTKEIAAVRKQFEEAFHPTRTRQAASGRVKVSGVGFFGPANSRITPDNASGVRLQPLVKLEVLKGGTSSTGSPEEKAK